MRIPYYKNLDGVRGLAAIMVMFFHFFHRSFNNNSMILNVVKKISILGQTGVTLFFVLSGFLITRILLNTKSDEGYFKKFYLRRSLRIFPLYYFFLFFSFFVAPYLFGSGEPCVYSRYTPVSDQLYFYTYLQNFARTFGWLTTNGPGHFWSLAVEEHFYLFWPFIIYFFSNKNIIRIIALIIVFAFTLRIYMVNNGVGVFYFTFTRFDSLAIGALLAFLELKKYFNSDKLKLVKPVLLILVVSIGLISFFFSGEGNNYVQVVKYLILPLTYFFGLWYVLSIKHDSFINKSLNFSYLQFSGKVSYGLYVYHPFVYFLIDSYLSIDYIILDFLVKFSLSYLISFISFELLEKKFLKLKKHFEY
ncbi:acyltransferase family protein [Polaribacter sp. SA4-12]|uniref:acyltransferase family protein n=1 Tax=Polaribacter sp. SA4-12 TaxID=1312072 RepID=UPI000B3CE6B5|nr:acyltransferase [Polaribacter sp. SA4-12]ARV15119.1 hypothetical protein BTO07_08125 [Polaribacter sp. SA4-12]